jgi:hypothetical protein
VGLVAGPRAALGGPLEHGHEDRPEHQCMVTVLGFAQNFSFAESACLIYLQNVVLIVYSSDPISAQCSHHILDISPFSEV